MLAESEYHPAFDREYGIDVVAVDGRELKRL
jgi:hypothetical protein